MLKLDLSRDVGDFLAGLPGKQFKQVVSALFALLKNPHPQDSRPLTGMDGYHRVDMGEYRIIFRVEDDLLRVPVIGKRNDDAAYRQLARKL
jgi:mRNA interferase RelE/StbE